MAQYNTETTLNALYKEIYADSINNLLPENTRFTQLVPFKDNDSPGDKYIEPAVVAQEHGFSTGTGAFTLKDHIAAEMVEAQVEGYSQLLRTAIGYDAADRMASTKQAFEKAGDLLFTNMLNSMSKRVEVANLYGRTGLGVIESINSNTLTITEATWAPGIWTGSKGALLNGYDLVSGGTRQDTAGAGYMSIASMSLANRTVTVDDASGLAAGDFLFWHGYYGAEQYGLDFIATNTGTLYNISATTYADVWAASSYSAGSAKLTMGKVLAAASQSSERGCEEDLVLMCNNRSFGDLNADLAALRMYDGSYSPSKGTNGVEGIEYFGDNGKIKIVPSTHIKRGEAFLFPPKRMKRIGSSDVTFNRPGSEGKIFLDLATAAGYEVRCRTNQTLYCQRPAYIVKITGIVNSQAG